MFAISLTKKVLLSACPRSVEQQLVILGFPYTNLPFTSSPRRDSPPYTCSNKRILLLSFCSSGRVSMAYILGFSNKPFKDGGPPAPPQPPPPRRPSVFKQMVSHPSAILKLAAFTIHRSLRPVVSSSGQPVMAAAAGSRGLENHG